MNNRIDIRGIGIKCLAHHPAGLSVRILPCPINLTSAAQHQVATQSIPEKIKGVPVKPHIGAAGGDFVFVFSRVKRRRAGYADIAGVANVALSFELAYSRC